MLKKDPAFLKDGYLKKIVKKPSPHSLNGGSMAFFPYRKSFLCYWLCPFVGFIYILKSVMPMETFSSPPVQFSPFMPSIRMPQREDGVAPLPSPSLDWESALQAGLFNRGRTVSMKGAAPGSVGWGRSIGMEKLRGLFNAEELSQTSSMETVNQNKNLHFFPESYSFSSSFSSANFSNTDNLQIRKDFCSPSETGQILRGSTISSKEPVGLKSTRNGQVLLTETLNRTGFYLESLENYLKQKNITSQDRPNKKLHSQSKNFKWFWFEIPIPKPRLQSGSTVQAWTGKPTRAFEKNNPGTKCLLNMKINLSLNLNNETSEQKDTPAPAYKSNQRLDLLGKSNGLRVPVPAGHPAREPSLIGESTAYSEAMRGFSSAGQAVRVGTSPKKGLLEQGVLIKERFGRELPANFPMFSKRGGIENPIVSYKKASFLLDHFYKKQLSLQPRQNGLRRYFQIEQSPLQGYRASQPSPKHRGSGPEVPVGSYRIVNDQKVSFLKQNSFDTQLSKKYLYQLLFEKLNKSLTNNVLIKNEDNKQSDVYNQIYNFITKSEYANFNYNTSQNGNSSLLWIPYDFIYNYKTLPFFRESNKITAETTAPKVTPAAASQSNQGWTGNPLTLLSPTKVGLRRGATPNGVASPYGKGPLFIPPEGALQSNKVGLHRGATPNGGGLRDKLPSGQMAFGYHGRQVAVMKLSHPLLFSLNEKKVSSSFLEYQSQKNSLNRKQENILLPLFYKKEQSPLVKSVPTGPGRLLSPALVRLSRGATPDAAAGVSREFICSNAYSSYSKVINLYMPKIKNMMLLSHIYNKKQNLSNINSSHNVVLTSSNIYVKKNHKMTHIPKIEKLCRSFLSIKSPLENRLKGPTKVGLSRGVPRGCLGLLKSQIINKWKNEQTTVLLPLSSPPDQRLGGGKWGSSLGPLKPHFNPLSLKYSPRLIVQNRLVLSVRSLNYAARRNRPVPVLPTAEAVGRTGIKGPGWYPLSRRDWPQRENVVAPLPSPSLDWEAPALQTGFDKNDMNLSAKTPKSNQKQHRKKKITKQTNERKKRTRLTARPLWIRYRIFNSLYTKRYIRKTQWNIAKNEKVMPIQKSNLFRLQNRVFALSQSKVRLGGGATPAAGSLMGQPSGAGGVVNTKFFSTNSNQQFYKISRNVLGDLKRLFWKSDWLRLHFNPYVKKVDTSLKKMKQNAQNWDFVTNLQLLLSYLGGFDSLPPDGTGALAVQAGASQSNLGLGRGSTTYSRCGLRGVARPYGKGAICPLREGLCSPTEVGLHRGATPFGVAFGQTKHRLERGRRSNQIREMWQTALYLAEYNRISYERLQNYVSQIRDNCTPLGHIKTRSPHIVYSSMQRLTRQREADLQKSADFWVKLGKIVLNYTEGNYQTSLLTNNFNGFFW